MQLVNLEDGDVFASPNASHASATVAAPPDVTPGTTCVTIEFDGHAADGFEVIIASHCHPRSAVAL